MSSNRPFAQTCAFETEDAERHGAWSEFAFAVQSIAPLFPVAAGLILGIAVDDQVRGSVSASWVGFTFVLAIAVLGFACSRFSIRAGPPTLFVVAFSAGGLLHLQSQRTPAPGDIALVVNRETEVVRVAGVVASEPRPLTARETPFSRWSFHGERTAFVLRTTSIASDSGWVSATGKVRVVVRELVLDLREGELVEITGWLSPLPPARNPGAFDWSTWQRRQGIAANLTCAHRENVRRLDPLAAKKDTWVRSLRASAASLVTEGVAQGSEESGLLDALVLGQRSEIDERVNEAFVKAGCVHFLAASGTNVAMVATFVWFLSRVLRLTHRSGAALVFAAILLYAVLAEPRPPIFRATITGGLFCVAVATGRERSVLNWLSAAAIVLLLLDPTTVFDIGFQLSFLAVLGVAYLTGPVTYALSGEWIANFRTRRQFELPATAEAAVNPLMDATLHLRPRYGILWMRLRTVSRTYLAASIAAWLAGMPVVADTFHRIQPYGAIGSCIALPLVYLAMVVGFTRAAMSAVFPAGGDVLGTILVWLEGSLLWVVEKLAAVPGASLDVRSPPGWWIGIFYAFLLAAILPQALRRLRPSLRPIGIESAAEERCPLRIVTIALAMLTIAATVAWSWPRVPPGQLIATVLDAGEGSATVVELPNGEVMLVNVGSRSFADVGRDVVRPFLRQRGIRRLGEVVLSRAYLDHFNGLPSVLEGITAGSIRVAPGFGVDCAERAACRELLRLVKRAGHMFDTAEPDGRWEQGQVTFEWIVPSTEAAPSGLSEPVTALRLTYLGQSILFAQNFREQQVQALRPETDRRAHVLLLPRDWKDESSRLGFINSVGARILVEIGSVRTTVTARRIITTEPECDVFNPAVGGAVRIAIDESGIHTWYAPNDESESFAELSVPRCEAEAHELQLPLVEPGRIREAPDRVSISPEVWNPRSASEQCPHRDGFRRREQER